MKIALCGYGIEGQSAYRYLHEHNKDYTFDIYDQNSQPKVNLPEGVTFFGGVETFRDLDADLVIRTPAIPPSEITTRGRVSSVTNIFFEECRVPIIAVTGTKGKGTTSSMIAAMLRKAEKKVWLIGNIGTPALDVLDEISEYVEEHDDGYVVYELSSFQAWDLKKSPHIAVVLMIEPEHLNVHGTFENYVAAKKNIVTSQTADDFVIYNAGNTTSTEIALSSQAYKIPFEVSASANQFSYDGVNLFERSDMHLYGEHNLENAYAAALSVFQITHTNEGIAEALREFKTLPHRLEPFTTKNGVLYIDDSFSSAPPAALVAVRSFSQPTILIMGGYDRGISFEDVAKGICDQQNLKKVLLIGQTASVIAGEFEKNNWDQFELLGTDLSHAVTRASELAVAGDVVLLSPGCASFDMFKDFSERGDLFKRYVGELL